MNIGASEIDGTIYAGNLKTVNGTKIQEWIGYKHDVTDEAFNAVATSILVTNSAMEFEYNNGKEYKLQVVEINK